MRYKSLFIIISAVVFVSCTKTEPRRPVNKDIRITKDYSVEINKEINTVQQNLIEKYTSVDSLLTYKQSTYGFVYAKIQSSNKTSKVIKKGTKVTFLKTVSSLKNEVIYPEQQQIALIGQTELTAGEEEGVKLMQEDEEFKFIFTSFVAHGFKGDNDRIGRNVPIIVNIKLLKIEN